MTSQSAVSIWNPQLELLSQPELKALQLERLKKLLVGLKAKVPMYQQRLANFNEDKINKLTDLKHLPFTNKSDIRNNYPLGLLAVPSDQISRLHVSSGTKGKPTIAAYSKADIQVWTEVCARSLVAAGVHTGEIIQNCYNYGLFTGGLGIHYGAEAIGATIIPASSGRTQQQILLLQDLLPTVICCTPSYALNIAFAMDELNIDLSTIKLRLGIFGAEPATEEMRKQLETRLGIRALDIYGLTEIIGPGVAMQCDQEKQSFCGLHIWEDHFLPEVIDPDSGEPLGFGQEGELVFTTLTKQAAPMIRYRTGDISYLIEEPCSCGRTMVRMAPVKARLDDMLVIRGVNLYPSEVERVILNIEELAPHYRLIIDREKALDSLTVEVELSASTIQRWGTFSEDHSEFKGLSQRIKERLKDVIGLWAEVALLTPKSLVRSEGKAVRVVDNRQNKENKNGKNDGSI